MIHYTVRILFSAIPALQYIILNAIYAQLTVIPFPKFQVNAEATVDADEEQIKSKKLSRVKLFR